MSLPDVHISESNGNIGGLIATSDGTVGIVMTGATEGTVTAGTPFSVGSATDITALGLTNTNNAAAVKFFADFLAESANQNINQFKLFVLLVASTMKVNQMADNTNANGAKKLMDYAAGKIRVIAVMSNDTLVYPGGTGLTQVGGINDDCYTAIANLQTLCAAYATAQKPCRGIVAGTSFNGTAANLIDQTANTKNKVLCLIGDTVSGTGCALGVLLGRIAAIPVQRKISRVKDGAIQSTTAFISTTSADVYASTEAIYDKGFVTFRQFASKTGFYFGGDQTCSATTDDYHLFCRGRVSDKARVLGYAVLVNEIDDEVLTVAGGQIDPGYAKWLESLVVNQLKLQMVAVGNCSAVDAFVDPAQNIVSTSQLNMVLKIRPVGYNSDIEVVLGYEL